MGFDGPFDREHHARQCRGMEDTVDSFERMLERVTNADVSLDDLGGGIHVLAPARCEIIEQAHAHPTSNQRVDKMRTNKPGAASHRYEAWRRRISRSSITRNFHFQSSIRLAPTPGVLQTRSSSPVLSQKGFPPRRNGPVRPRVDIRYPNLPVLRP